MQGSGGEQNGHGPGGGVQVQVNGEPRSVEPGSTVADLLDELEVDRRGVAVERNRKVVRRSEMDEIVLESGDTLEIVQFVGGG